MAALTSVGKNYKPAGSSGTSWTGGTGAGSRYSLSTPGVGTGGLPHPPSGPEPAGTQQLNLQIITGVPPPEPEVQRSIPIPVQNANLPEGYYIYDTQGVRRDVREFRNAGEVFKASGYDYHQEAQLELEKPARKVYKRAGPFLDEWSVPAEGYESAGRIKVYTQTVTARTEGEARLAGLPGPGTYNLTYGRREYAPTETVLERANREGSEAIKEGTGTQLLPTLITGGAGLIEKAGRLDERIGGWLDKPDRTLPTRALGHTLEVGGGLIESVGTDIKERPVTNLALAGSGVILRGVEMGVTTIRSIKLVSKESPVIARVGIKFTEEASPVLARVGIRFTERESAPLLRATIRVVEEKPEPLGTLRLTLPSGGTVIKGGLTATWIGGTTVEAVETRGDSEALGRVLGRATTEAAFFGAGYTLAGKASRGIATGIGRAQAAHRARKFEESVRAYEEQNALVIPSGYEITSPTIFTTDVGRPAIVGQRVEGIMTAATAREFGGGDIELVLRRGTRLGPLEVVQNLPHPGQRWGLLKLSRTREVTTELLPPGDRLAQAISRERLYSEKVTELRVAETGRTFTIKDLQENLPAEWSEAPELHYTLMGSLPVGTARVTSMRRVDLFKPLGPEKPVIDLGDYDFMRQKRLPGPRHALTDQRPPAPKQFEPVRIIEVPGLEEYGPIYVTRGARIISNPLQATGLSGAMTGDVFGGASVTVGSGRQQTLLLGQMRLETVTEPSYKLEPTLEPQNVFNPLEAKPERGAVPQEFKISDFRPSEKTILDLGSKTGALTGLGIGTGVGIGSTTIGGTRDRIRDRGGQDIHEVPISKVTEDTGQDHRGRQTQIPEPIQTPRLREPQLTTHITPIEQLIPELPKLPHLPETGGGTLYDVLVRRRGTFSVVSGRPLPPGEAILLGKQTLLGTPAASFKLRGHGPNRLSAGKVLGVLGGDFALSKREPDVFIQKRGKRIQSAGELAGITYKGQAALRLRRSR